MKRRQDFVANESLVPLSRLREAFAYDPDTGSITWCIAVGRARRSKVAGHAAPDGYIDITIDGVCLQAHRLAWYLHTGCIAQGEIDHFDGNRSNNRFANLRDATREINRQNMRAPMRTNRIGVLGVRRHRLRFVARIWIDGRSVHIGSYPTADLAHAAYVAVKRQLHAGCSL